MEVRSCLEMLGRVLLFIASSTLFHAAFSAYEYLSHLKALGQQDCQLPQSIVWEALISLVLGILGASFDAPQLKEITWASEMKNRNKIDVMDSRMGFASYVTRGRSIFPHVKVIGSGH